MSKRSGSPGDSTRSVHGGERQHQSSDSVTTPIYQSSTFWFRDSAELIAYQEGRTTRERVYAGGDAVTGAATVILAAGAGKRAAEAIHLDLSAAGDE